ALLAELSALAPRWQLHRLAGDAGTAEGYTALALGGLELIRTLLLQPAPSPRRLQLVLREGEHDAWLALSGLLKTATQENPDLQGQIIIVDDMESARHVHARLRDEAEQPLAPVVRYRGAARQVLGWAPCEEPDDAPALPYQEHGVYLITGGLGGLGRLFAANILRRTRHAKVVLTGRAPAEAAAPRLQAMAAELDAAA